MEQKILVRSLKEMKKLAKVFYQTLQGGEVILLEGDLGAGKTTFTKMLCHYAKVKEDVTSPTFTIMREYWGKTKHIVHFDLYRIEQAQDVQEFGFDEYVYATQPDQIVLIEWPYNIQGFQYPKCIKILIEKIDDDTRQITIDR